MRVKENVFGSKNEKDLFKTLESHWSHEFDLFPSLPFPAIVDIQDAVLSEKERDYLFKTSVDYTLCTKLGKPIVSVEFDGLCHGFSRNGTFVEVVTSIRDPHRKLKMDLKLAIANKVKYPFFVVSYEEKVPIDKDLTLTIVDGVIGQVLAHLYFEKIINDRIAENSLLCEDLPPDEEHEIIQDIVIGTEVEAEYRWNPILKEAGKYQSILQRRGLPWMTNRIKFHHDPKLPEGNPWDFNNNTFNLDIAEKRMMGIQNAERVGVTVSIVTANGELSETAWVRNLEGYGVSPTSLAENIAELILYRNLLSKSDYDNRKE
jgi:hypothetical protein